MGCCDADSVQVSKMALEIKSGPMLWYKRRFFGSNWRDVHSVLYNDSSLLWYKDKSRQESEGGVVVKDAPELVAFGTFTSQVPNRPDLPEHYEPKELLAFGVRGKDVVYWFLCPNEEEVASWMSAIASTLPVPPTAPQMVPSQMPSSHPQPATAPPDSNQEYPSTPQYHPGQPAPQYRPQQPPPQYTPNSQHMPQYAPQAAAGLPGQYPHPTNYRPPPYQPHNTVRPYPQQYPSYPAASGGGGGGTPTTVIVQQDRPGYASGGGGGVGAGGGFAMGMLLGGALGTAWGSSHNHHGFGGGWGTGGGWGHGSNAPDTNININNYYDNDTTTVNNNLDMTNNTSIEQTDPEQDMPVPAPLMAEEYAPVQESTDYIPVEEVTDYVQEDAVEYIPVEEPVDYMPMVDAGDGMYDGGDYDTDFGGGDFGGGDFGGGDFGDF
ncbi:PH domain-containing protein [Caerostris darwini]|uniref:PH domain-containing protein n=1 Tax=Caerostris darwini TaxID=1538125 RepID=A0AAV4WBJ1_9ARAC|nr:PH domain-containing protein [Caerostris darwini]